MIIMPRPINNEMKPTIELIYGINDKTNKIIIPTKPLNNVFSSCLNNLTKTNLPIT